MGFLLSVPRAPATEEPQVTTTLFDIAADLDTPVSAFLKLKPFRPRFLLESVEGGERLARYSFIGFGDCLESGSTARAAGQRQCAARVPADQAALLGAPARGARGARRDRDLTQAGLPLPAAWSAVAGYDLVRYFERLPAQPSAARGARCRTTSRRARCSSSTT